MSKACKLMKNIWEENSANPQVLSDSEASPVEILIPIEDVFDLAGPRKKLLKRPVAEELRIPDFFAAERLCEKPNIDLEHTLDPLIPLVKFPENPCSEIDFHGQFNYWTECLMQGLNLLLYGAGSKLQVLNDFQDFLVDSKYNVIRVNAFKPIVTVRKILIEVLNFIGSSEKGTVNIDRLLTRLLSALNDTEQPIFLLLDSLDSSCIIDCESQLVLSRLANHHKIYFAATMDNCNLMYRWSIDTNIKFNFLYIPCATMANYSAELSFSEGVKVFDYASSHNSMRGIDYVLKSLTLSQRKILKELAYVHIKEPNGITFKEFLDRCIEETLVLNSKQLKDAMVEAIDHQIAVYKPGPKGETLIHLKIDPIILTNKII